MGQEGGGRPLRWGTGSAQTGVIYLKFLPPPRDARGTVSWHHPAGERSSLAFAYPGARAEPGRGDFSLPFLHPLQFSRQIWQFLYLPEQRAAAAALGRREPRSRRCSGGSANSCLSTETTEGRRFKPYSGLRSFRFEEPLSLRESSGIPITPFSPIFLPVHPLQALLTSFPKPFPIWAARRESGRLFYGLLHVGS